MRALLVLLMLVAPLAAAAEVYKWVDEKGVVHYTDQPPADDAKPAKLPPLQTYKEGARPDLRKFDKTPTTTTNKTAGAGVQIQVVTPGHDETFRGGERSVPVAVMVTPSLAEGQSLMYYMDGVARSSTTTDTSFVMTDVERGSHSVSVALIERGQEVARSSTVTFHMKPPTARRN